MVKKIVLIADAKEVGVGNAAEETFRNQDELNVGRFAANAINPSGSFQALFCFALLPSDPIALR